LNEVKGCRSSFSTSSKTIPTVESYVYYYNGKTLKVIRAHSALQVKNPYCRKLYYNGKTLSEVEVLE
jgi:hypothetical protein